MKKISYIVSFVFIAGLFSPVFCSASYENGTLLKSSDGKVWVINNNKRHWILNETIFNINGYNWENVEDVSDIELAKIPFNNLFRAPDNPKVYAYNDAGFKRWIKTLEIFVKYGLSFDNVVLVHQSEISAHSDTDLIKVAGSNTIYDLTDEVLRPIKDIATFNSLGKNWLKMQTIISDDFANYALGEELASVGSQAPEQPTIYETPTPSITSTPSPTTSPTPTTIPKVYKISLKDISTDPTGEGDNRTFGDMRFEILNEGNEPIEIRRLKIDSVLVEGTDISNWYIEINKGNSWLPKEATILSDKSSIFQFDKNIESVSISSGNKMTFRIVPDTRPGIKSYQFVVKYIINSIMGGDEDIIFSDLILKEQLL
jgi:hypothetical protein